MVIFFFHTFISFWDSINPATKLKPSGFFPEGKKGKGIPLRTFKCVTGRTEGLKVPACESMIILFFLVMEIPSQGEDCAHS